MFDKSFRVIYEDQEYLLQEIIDALKSIEYVFEERKLIILLAENDLFSLSMYLNAINSKVPIMLLNGDTDYEELERIAKNFDPQFIIRRISDQNILSYKKSQVLFDGYEIHESLKNPSVKIFDELAILLPTSGSTGSSKFVRISYKNILANSESIIKYLLICRNNTSITTLPMNYSFGLSIINSYAMAGARLVLTSKSVIQREFSDMLLKNKVTSLSGVPYTYELLKKTGFLKKNFSSLTTLTQAGGRLSDELKVEFLKYAKLKKIKFYVMYGQTEATARISFVPPSRLKNKISSIGKSIPGGKLFIADTKDNQREGEIIYQGKNVTLGYATNINDLALGDKNNGLLHTGDLGYIDSSGYAFITGRKSRFIKIKGVRFGLDYLEKLLEEKFPYIDFRCYGADDNLMLDYCCKDNESKQIVQFLSKKTGIFHKLITVKSVSVIKRNKFGKKIYI